ncbi:TATA box-binding protein-associated factor RNA polymerase I subunit B [Selaginella moellendorffii]|uniref:TATA box-binding protein-associated factor RNA polymerase I subunit B n=1 Tax=Selaginella moellendorffii TaxID=88036 RepID=UPI000D1C4522|nr:TATA box-binding protein-associated factor RNA polymerase I subunit B [Selaginella moellendorffii]|eukprot:XP_024542729.1 TATA box-binding protein-associated factor RNA polymerase I subunit B [Selaginella moellendorffii]
MDSAVCETCGNVGLQKGGDGFHYCTACGTQSQNFMEEDLGDFDGTLGQDATGRRTFAYARHHNVERQEQEEQLRKLNEMLRGATGDLDRNIDDPAAARAREEALLRAMSQRHGEEEAALERMRDSLASQFVTADKVHIWSGSQQMYDVSELPDRLAAHIREYYVQGLQTIIQLQCESLVENFGVSPLICRIVGPIWLRFVASTRVFEREWASEAILLADARSLKEKAKKLKLKKESSTLPAPEKIEAKNGGGGTNKSKHAKPRRKKKAKRLDKVPFTQTGLKMSRVWTDSLKRRLPLRITLAMVFLACYVIREPVLATDISTWAGQGSLPYLTAFLSMQPKRFSGPDLKAIHVAELDPRNLFRPLFLSNASMIELLAAHVASRLELELPTVNFQAISLSLLKKLGIGKDEVMGILERLYQWYTPDGLWLSARKRAFPTSAYVTAMLIVALKILYNVYGNAVSILYWPAFLERLDVTSTRRANFQDQLETIEKELLEDALRPEAELKDYLNYCQEKVFAGTRNPPDEEMLYDHFWECFEKLSLKDPISEAGDDDPKQQKEEEVTTTQHRNISESDELTLGSGAWSRAPSIQKQKSGSSRELLDNDRNKDLQEQELGEIVTPAAAVELEEVTSENRELRRIQQAKNKLLDSISHELQACGFKLVPSSLPNGIGSAAAYSYAIFPLLDHLRKSTKYVYGDYFVLLYAFSKITKIKPNVIHKCVQFIEADLWRIEQRVERYVDRFNENRR